MKRQLKYLVATLCVNCFLLTACNNSNPSDNKNENSIMTKQHQDSIKQFLHDYVEEIWNKRDFSKADKYWGADFKNVFAPQFDHGPEGMKKQVDYFLSAFQPFHFEIMDIMIDGDKVSMWIEISGTHTGELFGIKPTNKQVKFREAVWYKLKDGKLDEVYPFVDWNSLFEQLGEYPQPENK
jgi:predicted ester cyclase